MFGKDFILQETTRILRAADTPLSIQEITNEVRCRGETHLGIELSKLYSPFQTYHGGERLYHVGKYKSWFTVSAPVQPNSLSAIFDDGVTRQLQHSAPPQADIRFGPERAIEKLQDAVETYCRSSHDVIKLQEYYVHRDSPAGAVVNGIANPIAFATLTRMRKHQSPNAKTELLSKMCDRFNLRHLYYLTLVENIPSILEHGILAKNLAPSGHASFADEDIQSKRHLKRPRQDIALTLHDYVPLFFAPKPPLLYAIKNSGKKLACLLVDPIVLLEPGMAFSAVNARSATTFYTKITDLDHLNWEILHADYWKSDDPAQHQRNKRFRQAEVQIPLSVPPERITEIAVRDQDICRKAKNEVVSQSLSILVHLDYGRLL